MFFRRRSGLYLSSGRRFMDAVWRYGRCAWRGHSASRLFSDFRVIEAKETIRATVVGAGSYTTSVSGSTITYNRDVFPLKNIPVLKLSDEEQQACFLSQTEGLTEKLRWMQSQSNSGQLILAMKGKPDPSYMEVKQLAAWSCECFGCFAAGRSADVDSFWSVIWQRLWGR